MLQLKFNKELYETIKTRRRCNNISYDITTFDSIVLNSLTSLYTLTKGSTVKNKKIACFAKDRSTIATRPGYIDFEYQGVLKEKKISLKGIVYAINLVATNPVTVVKENTFRVYFNSQYEGATYFSLHLCRYMFENPHILYLMVCIDILPELKPLEKYFAIVSTEIYTGHMHTRPFKKDGQILLPKVIDFNKMLIENKTSSSWKFEGKPFTEKNVFGIIRFRCNYKDYKKIKYLETINVPNKNVDKTTNKLYYGGRMYKLSNFQIC